MGCLRSLFLILLIKSWEANSITTRIEQRVPVRNFRRHTGPLPPTDWELGLREAVHQSFIREHRPDPDLHDRILAAPIIGRQDSATPFGDIAVLARGQVYQTSSGYQFVQDAYQNDCDDCHNPNVPKCINPPCEPWHTGGEKSQLLALWTVKRIRHRNPHYGHIFELEYTISPVTAVVREGLLMRNGHFNYNVPGHVFVIKSDPKLNSAYYQHHNAEKHQKIAEWYHDDNNHHGYDSKSPGFFKPGIVVGVTPDGYKQVLQSYPGFFSSYQPTTTYQNHDQTTVDPKEYELYKKLIESLAQKTTHRFAPSTTQSTEFVRFPDGQLYPITTTKVPTTDNVNFPVRFPQTLHEDIFGPPPPTTQTTSLNFPSFSTTISSSTAEMRFSPQEPVFNQDTSLLPPKTTPITTVHYFTPIEEEPEEQSVQTSVTKPVSTSTESNKKLSIPDLSPTTTSKLPQTVAMTKLTTVTKPSTTIKLTTVTKPTRTSGSTKLTTIYKKPPKTTQRRKPTILESSGGSEEDFDLFPESKVTKPILQSTTLTSTTIKTTSTKPSTLSEKTFGIDAFPINTQTEPMTTVLVTSTSPKPHPDSINEQLSPPDNDTDTTIPYVSATATQSTVISTTSKETTQTQPSTLVQFTAETTERTETIPKTTERPTTLEMTTTRETTEKEPVITTTKKYVYTFTTDDIRKSTRPVEETTVPQTTSPGVESTGFESTTLREPTGETSTFTNTHAGSTRPYSTIIYEGSGTTSVTETTDGGDTGTTPIGTTTSGDDTTLITTTSQKPSKSTTKKYDRKTKPTKTSTTTASDYEFLASESGDVNKSSVPSDNKKDIDEDDIFGKEMKPQKTQKPTKAPVQKVTQSDLEEALFGGSRRAKQIKLSSVLTPRSTTPANTTKIIYADFFAASTEVPHYHRESSLRHDVTTEYHPLTEQSQSTSISFQVNNNTNTPPFANLDLEPTIMAKITEVVDNHGDYRIYKAELPEMTTPLYTSGKSETRKVFDDVALQLVNHARSIDYLNKKSSRRPKYKRRSYPPKVPRGSRRLNGNRNGKSSGRKSQSTTQKTSTV